MIQNLLLNDGRGEGLIAKASHFENVDDVVHGDVASKQLLPHLYCSAAHGSSPHVFAEQSEEGNALSVLRCSDGFANLHQFSLHSWVVKVALGVEEGESVLNFLPTSLRSKPSRRFREKEQRSEKNECRDTLNTPSNTEG